MNKPPVKKYGRFIRAIPPAGYGREPEALLNNERREK